MANALGPILVSKMAPIVHTATKKFYHACWIDYCNSLHRKKFNFSNRLSTAYGIKPSNISSKREEIRRNRDPITSIFDPNANEL